MFLSKYLLPTQKEAPADTKLISHQLMIRCGMIRQLTSGIYEWLPFGLRVLQNISDIVRQELNKKDCVELLLPAIQPVSLWEKSGRYGQKNSELQEEMLTMSDRHDNKLVFAPTAEEAICEVFTNTVHSYKQLPQILYQVGWKFRDEIRPRYGVMRSREFLMKDAYSFDLTEEDAFASYDKMLSAYLHMYQRMGLNAIPVTASSGDIGGDLSHEMHVLAQNGESTIYYEDNILNEIDVDDISVKKLNSFYAREEEKHDANTAANVKNLKQSKSIEVGHLFYLGDKYSKKMGCLIQNDRGENIIPKMGCYGVGISRLVAAVIECNNDSSGIIWPMQIAPFKCIIVNLQPQNSICNAIAMKIYDSLNEAKIDTLYDDTHDSPGVKLNRMDLLGIPMQLIIGKTTAENNTVDFRKRSDPDRINKNAKINVEEVINRCMHTCILEDLEAMHIK